MTGKRIRVMVKIMTTTTILHNMLVAIDTSASAADDGEDSGGEGENENEGCDRKVKYV